MITKNCPGQCPGREQSFHLKSMDLLAGVALLRAAAAVRFEPLSPPPS
jgi:hypothetical protein